MDLVGLDAASRMIVSFEIGDRSEQTALIFMHDLESRIEGPVQITTDGHKPYIEAVKATFADGPIMPNWSKCLVASLNSSTCPMVRYNQ